MVKKQFFVIPDEMKEDLHTMYETHMSMLLVGFDRITRGGSANKLHFIPIEKQAHLKKYYCPENLDSVEQNLISCMKWFQEDTQEICKLKGLDYFAYSGNQQAKKSEYVEK